MGLKDELRQLRAGLKGQLSCFKLQSGRRYWYDEAEAVEELFLHGVACLKAGRAEDRPEPPEIVRALVKAKDRRRVLEALGPLPFWPYECEPFVESGELVHRSLVADRDLDESACEDLSEPR